MLWRNAAKGGDLLFIAKLGSPASVMPAPHGPSSTSPIGIGGRPPNTACSLTVRATLSTRWRKATAVSSPSRSKKSCPIVANFSEASASWPPNTVIPLCPGPTRPMRASTPSERDRRLMPCLQADARLPRASPPTRQSHTPPAPRLFRNPFFARASEKTLRDCGTSPARLA